MLAEVFFQTIVNSGVCVCPGFWANGNLHGDNETCSNARKIVLQSIYLVSRNADLLIFFVNVCVIIHSTGGCQHQLSFGASGQSVSAASVSQAALGPAVKQVVGAWTARTIAGEQSLPFGLCRWSSLA